MAQVTGVRRLPRSIPDGHPTDYVCMADDHEVVDAGDPMVDNNAIDEKLNITENVREYHIVAVASPAEFSAPVTIPSYPGGSTTIGAEASTVLQAVVTRKFL